MLGTQMCFYMAPQTLHVEAYFVGHLIRNIQGNVTLIYDTLT